MKRIILTAMIVIMAVAIYRERYFIYLLVYTLYHDPYKYRNICFQNSDKCVTVITYTNIGIGGENPYKRYVVFGKKKDKAPPKVNYIEFPEYTDLVVFWESESLCKIISNSDPEKEMELSKNAKVEVISGNVEFEKYRSKFPELVIY